MALAVFCFRDKMKHINCSSPMDEGHACVQSSTGKDHWTPWGSTVATVCVAPPCQQSKTGSTGDELLSVHCPNLSSASASPFTNPGRKPRQHLAASFLTGRTNGGMDHPQTMHITFSTLLRISIVVIGIVGLGRNVAVEMLGARGAGAHARLANCGLAQCGSATLKVQNRCDMAAE
jgi:hypothetical protein